MKILNNYTNYQQPNFTSLKISYNAREALISAKGSFISGLFEAGKRLENTQFVDLHVLKDLSLRIKEKANVFSGIKEPLQLKIYKQKNLKVTGIYDGLDYGKLKKGHKIDYYLKFETPEQAEELYNRYQTMGKVGQFSFITKLIDEDKIRQNTMPRMKETNREKFVDLMFDIFGELGI